MVGQSFPMSARTSASAGDRPLTRGVGSTPTMGLGGVPRGLGCGADTAPAVVARVRYSQPPEEGAEEDEQATLRHQEVDAQ